MILTEKEAFQRLYNRGYFLFIKDVPIGWAIDRIRYTTRYSIIKMSTMMLAAGTNECMKIEDVEEFINRKIKEPGTA